MSDNGDAAFDAALARHRASDLDGAAAAYRRILDADPTHAGAWLNLGAAERGRGRTSAAVAALSHAADLAPGHPGVHYNLGNALADAGELDNAAVELGRACDADPDFADAHANLGDVLVRLGRCQDAIAAIRRGLAAVPGHGGLLSNLGNALLIEGDLAEAETTLAAAATALPDVPSVQRNLGNLLRITGRLDDAEDYFRRVLDHDPEDAEARTLLGLCRLAAGRFGAGWDGYAWRWRIAAHEPARPFDAPAWNGAPLAGRSILVWGEQAVGDELMFATMYADLAAVGAKVTVETEYRLAPLFARSFPNFHIVARRDPPAPALRERRFDFQVAAGDLGRHLRRTGTDFESGEPYLKADLVRTASFRDAYAALASGRRRVGLSWRSGAEQPGLARSVPPADMAALLWREDCWFVSLQYGDVADDIAAFADRGAAVHVDPTVDPLQDMDAAAAQMAALDLVISPPNTTVHLAGALGVPAWVPTPALADWRWGRTGAVVPWYGSVRLFRMVADGDWAGPLAVIGAALDDANSSAG